MAEYGAELAGDRPSKDFGQHLIDFEFLYQHANDPAKLAATSDLAAWLSTFSGGAEPGQVIERWRRSKSQAWLIAALRYASTDSDITDLVNAARSLKISDPAYESAVHYAIALEIRRGHRNSARVWADDALRRPLLLSSRNRLLYERMKVARDWNDFLRFAARAPEPGLSFYDEDEVQGAGAWAHSGPLFDVDAVQVLNSRVPIQLLLAATRSRSLPPRLQVQIAQAGFVRSIVLGRPMEEKEFMQRMVDLNPALAESAHELLSEPDADAAHFAAILLVLRSSSLSGILWPRQLESQ